MQEMLDFIDPAKKMLQVAELNTKGADNWTALHYAANEGHGDILEALIGKNIDLSAVTNQLRTALHLAAARGNTDICRLLCDQAAIDRNSIDVDGNTSLHLASQQGQLEAITFLLSEAHVDYSIKNSVGYLAFDTAYNTDVQNLLNELIGTQGGTNEENKN